MPTCLVTALPCVPLLSQLDCTDVGFPCWLEKLQGSDSNVLPLLPCAPCSWSMSHAHHRVISVDCKVASVCVGGVGRGAWCYTDSPDVRQHARETLFVTKPRGEEGSLVVQGKGQASTPPSIIHP